VSTTPGIKLTCTHDGCDERTIARRLCRAHYQQAWKAGALGKHQPLPPRKRKRTRCPADHKHAAASTCFIQHQCRCTPCVDAHNARERTRKKQKAYGRFDTGLVDVAPVREHVLKLAEFGIGYKRVAELAGFKSSTPVRTIIWGRQDPGPRYGEMQKRVKRETAEKILAIRPTIENLGSRRPVSARGAHRRVQALVARGWSLSKIAERVGMNASNFSTFMQRPMIGASTHLTIAALYEEMWDQLPPHEEWRDKIAYTRSLHFAEQRRWLPPLAWDDIDLDEEPPVPDEEVGVDETAVELAIAGEHVRLRPAERREIVTRLHPLKWSDGRIAEIIRCNVKTIGRIREELGLQAWDQAELRDKGAA
jgi:hypothetical protein